MSNFIFFYPILRCPDCHSTKLIQSANGSSLNCNECGAIYHFSYNRPVLLKSDNDVFNLEDYRKAKPFTQSSKGISRFIPTSSVNLSIKNILDKLKILLADLSSAKVLVVGGGKQRFWLDKLLGAVESIKIFYSDIDIHADVDLFCDGHDLPFQDSQFDAVITTAVLEHVLYPERVVAEIHRVLKTGGKLYSEMPFMQQVHEGAYDFTRYTLSGHRRLLNGFAEIESGMVAGPGTAMVWTIENFVLAFTKNPVVRAISKAIVRLTFFWIKYFDFFLKNRPEAMDSASCTFFFGEKLEEKISDADIIKFYKGAKHLHHT